jgi:hypothetical protein
MEKHDHLEFHVENSLGETLVLKDSDNAIACATAIAMGRGHATLDVVCWTEDAARAFGGEDAVERYREDPLASVFERWEFKANCVGRVP